MALTEGEKQRLMAMKRLNNEIAFSLSDYINQTPCAITKELLHEADPEGSMDENLVYTALLMGMTGWDVDDEKILKGYFLPSVRSLSKEEYSKDAYYSNIAFPDRTLGEWQLTHYTFRPYELFVADKLMVMPDMREVPQVGYFTEEFSYPVVMQKGREWMSIKPSETRTVIPAADKCSGRVLTFGLGLGYFVYLMCLKDDAESITVVEKDRSVIELFEKFILPQFPSNNKVRIIHKDAFVYMAEDMPKEHFDWCFADIWHDALDGLPLYMGFKVFEPKFPETHFLYWVEETLLSALRFKEYENIIAKAENLHEAVYLLSDRGLIESLRSR